MKVNITILYFGESIHLAASAWSHTLIYYIDKNATNKQTNKRKNKPKPKQ